LSAGFWFDFRSVFLFPLSLFPTLAVPSSPFFFCSFLHTEGDGRGRPIGDRSVVDNGTGVRRITAGEVEIQIQIDRFSCFGLMISGEWLNGRLGLMAGELVKKMKT
jgi:hypothetical protein